MLARLRREGVGLAAALPARAAPGSADARGRRRCRVGRRARAAGSVRRGDPRRGRPALPASRAPRIGAVALSLFLLGLLDSAAMTPLASVALGVSRVDGWLRVGLLRRRGRRRPRRRCGVRAAASRASAGRRAVPPRGLVGEHATPPREAAWAWLGVARLVGAARARDVRAARRARVRRRTSRSRSRSSARRRPRPCCRSRRPARRCRRARAPRSSSPPACTPRRRSRSASPLRRC